MGAHSGFGLKRALERVEPGQIWPGPAHRTSVVKRRAGRGKRPLGRDPRTHKRAKAIGERHGRIGHAPPRHFGLAGCAVFMRHLGRVDVDAAKQTLLSSPVFSAQNRVVERLVPLCLFGMPREVFEVRLTAQLLRRPIPSLAILRPEHVAVRANCDQIDVDVFGANRPQIDGVVKCHPQRVHKVSRKPGGATIALALGILQRVVPRRVV